MKLLTDLQKATMLGSPLNHDVQWVGGRVKDLCLSWSKLEKFNNCPRSFKHMYIDKAIPFDATNPTLVWGNKVHKAMEEYMVQGKKLGVEMMRFKHIADTIKSRVATLESEGKIKAPLNAEQDWAMTANGKFASWFDNQNVFMRNKADLVYGTTSTLFTFDWKTGKGNRPKPEQLEVVAMVAKAQPKLSKYEKNISALVFLEADKLVPLKVDMSTQGQEKLLHKYLSNGIEIVEAYESGEWAMNPTPLCGWCDDLTCPYNKKET